MSLQNFLNIRRQINKPEYFYNPKQILNRLTYKSENSTKKKANVFKNTPPFYVNENEVVGKSILTMGVYDLIIAESLVRILSPGQTFFDVGANIGYFTRLANTLRTSSHSFEPHPQIFKRLQENCETLQETTLYNLALSDQNGEFSLYVPQNFEKNEGIASLEPMPNSTEVKVQTKTLDSFQDPIRLLKIDVEGHEASVLKGARMKLKNKAIDYIIFEEFDGLEAESIQLLKSFGYTVLRLHKKLMGPELVSVEEGEKIPLWEPPNFIASHNKSELLQLFKSGGWKFY